MWEDPIVSEVRRAREQLSAKFGFDVKAIFADLRNRQAAHGDRLIHQPKNSQASAAMESKSAQVSG